MSNIEEMKLILTTGAVVLYVNLNHGIFSSSIRFISYIAWLIPCYMTNRRIVIFHLWVWCFVTDLDKIKSKEKSEGYHQVRSNEQRCEYCRHKPRIGRSTPDLRAFMDSAGGGTTPNSLVTPSHSDSLWHICRSRS